MAENKLNRLRALIGESAFADAEAKASRMTFGAKRMEGADDTEGRNNNEIPDRDAQVIVSGNLAAARDHPTQRDASSGTEAAEAMTASTMSSNAVAGAADFALCPVRALSHFPYKYMQPGSSESEQVSKTFFAAGEFWNRTWTCYYLCAPTYVSAMPLIFVPKEEVAVFFTNINQALGMELKIPGEKGFTVQFDDVRLPQPQYLGISVSKASFDLLHSVADDHRQDKLGFDDILLNVNPALRNSYTEKIRNVVHALQRGKKKKKINPAVSNNALWQKLQRTRSFLGLRSKTASDGDISSMVDISRPAPFPHDMNVVFVCIDVEAYEKNHSRITEIGISMLDTYDVRELAPGLKGKAWGMKIQSRHLRVKENSHLLNTDYVVGCPDNFEPSFGKSEFVHEADLKGILTACFGGASVSHDSSSSEGGIQFLGEKRNYVLVGHDIKNDINYLKVIGLDTVTIPNLIEVLDTIELYRALRQKKQAIGLSSLCEEFDIIPWHLHNAGNDAAYTLQCMLGIAVEGLHEPRLDDPSSKPKEQLQQQGATLEAAQDSDVEDGGVPLG